MIIKLENIKTGKAKHKFEIPDELLIDAAKLCNEMLGAMPNNAEDEGWVEFNLPLYRDVEKDSKQKLVARGTLIEIFEEGEIIEIKHRLYPYRNEGNLYLLSSTRVNLISLKSILEGYIAKRIMRSEIAPKGKNDTMSISKIEIVKRVGNTRRLQVIVNGDYEPTSINKFMPIYGHYWRKMYEIADKGQTEWDDGFFSYFNSNLRNPLYKTLGYEKTQILKSERLRRGEKASILPNVTIELITSKKAAQRKNKKT